MATTGSSTITVPQALHRQSPRNRAVQTLIVYPQDWQPNPTPRAYYQMDNGEAWGPLWPYAPDGILIGYIQPGQLNTDGRTLKETVEKINAGCTIETPRLHAGQYYPRICRVEETVLNLGQCVPRMADSPFFNSFIGSLQQIETLFDSLSSVFRVAHPEPGNFQAYGGAIRDLIILACTEVEAQWKGILKANNHQAPDGRYTTNHYIRLLPAMKLDIYRLQLVRYPGLPAFAPFEGWNSEQPTKSLAWYDAYNRIKHDREGAFNDATLANSIRAVAGCVVMLAAQFGYETLGEYRFNSVFNFTEIPKWDPTEWYYGPIPQTEWQPVDFPL